MDSMQPHLIDQKEGYIFDNFTEKDQIATVNSDLVFYDNLYLVRPFLFS